MCGAEEGKIGEVLSASTGDISVSFLTAYARGAQEGDTHACAPSLSAMNGRFDHTLSTAGSVPSSAPNQLSTSGPLQCQKLASISSP